jgi:hypothetical protein
MNTEQLIGFVSVTQLYYDANHPKYTDFKLKRKTGIALDVTEQTRYECIPVS